MNRDQYISEITKRLRSLFSASKEGYKTIPADKYKLEGMMKAGVLLGAMTSDEMIKLRDNIHLSVFGKTYDQRKNVAIRLN